MKRTLKQLMVIVVRYNNLEQRAPVVDGRFSAQVALRPGPNAIEVCNESSQRCSTTTLVADIERVAIMATLTWSSGDLDLHVEAPNGSHCDYSNKNIADVCMLDIDDQQGTNPENMTIPPSAGPGRYRFRVVNYSGARGSGGTLVIFADGEVLETVPFSVNVGDGDNVLVRDVTIGTQAQSGAAQREAGRGEEGVETAQAESGAEGLEQCVTGTITGGPTITGLGDDLRKWTYRFTNRCAEPVAIRWLDRSADGNDNWSSSSTTLRAGGSYGEDVLWDIDAGPTPRPLVVWCVYDERSDALGRQCRGGNDYMRSSRNWRSAG